MKTKSKKSAVKQAVKPAKTEKVETKVEAAPVEMIEVTVRIPKNPARAVGMRGLRGMVFGRFAQAFSTGKDLAKLPSCEEMTAEVQTHYPQSRWVANPKIHYSYYKSKFISGLNAPQAGQA